MAENVTSFPAPDSDIDLFHTCTRSGQSISVFCVLTTVYILMLPVFILVLHLGYKRRERRRPSSSDTSHTDLLTYHSIALQLNEVLGFIMANAGVYVRHEVVVEVGINILNVVFTGKTLFHLLTCVEHYLAVVHPITYLGLKQSASARIKHIRIGCVWLLSAAVIGLIYQRNYRFKFILNLSFIMFSLIGTSFCSVSVLWALRHPGPGNRVGAEWSKRRAFYTVMAIMGVLLFRFGGNLTVSVMLDAAVCEDRCVVWLSQFWFEFPSSLVLPLLFLQRAGKLQCPCAGLFSSSRSCPLPLNL